MYAWSLRIFGNWFDCFVLSRSVLTRSILLRSIAHLGVLRGLMEMGVPIDAVGGASMGSQIAGLIAQGFECAFLFRLSIDRVDDVHSHMNSRDNTRRA